MDGVDVDDESEPEHSIWEPEMQHVVDTDNIELPKTTVSKCIIFNFFTFVELYTMCDIDLIYSFKKKYYSFCYFNDSKKNKNENLIHILF